MRQQQFQDARLREVARRVGKPPRLFSALRWRHGRSAPPAGLAPQDPIRRIYARQGRILRDGFVRWGVVVHADGSLFTPGPTAGGAQVVYARKGDVSLADLQDVARRTSALKGTEPADPAERRVADMLADGTQRALDWPVPLSVTGGLDVVTTLVMLPPAHLPGGLPGMNHFPVLADPVSGMAVLVPQRYWPADLIREWQANAGAVARDPGQGQ